MHAYRTATPPSINGILNDKVWEQATPGSGFVQNMPYEGQKASQRTEVRILYDDYAIYIGAMLYDTAPDSILHQLGVRDADLNADKFRFIIDPYLTHIDAYDFGVYASGVQIDSRISDYTYNAVWESATKILDNGWSVEMEIPYSAIRFPGTQEQRWGLHMGRDIRRTREFDQWVLSPNAYANPLMFEGLLLGIHDIDPPLRLSTTPYISASYGSTPEYNANGSYSYTKSFTYNVGADIKYGLDERFTLDMTLLPDFGQVKSDSKVKNISYQEINYEESRPFFKEGVDLFNNKNNLFYSRRIGKTPAYFSSISDSLKPGELLENNPDKAVLLNATKISGRTNLGTGIGVFNAVTDNTYATIKDSAGNTRRILTEPFSNYNAVVFDQQLKNSSDAYFINTNVLRRGRKSRNANVTGTGLTLRDKSNTWQFSGLGNLSQVLTRNDSLTDNFNNQLGYFYSAGVNKISGTWQYGASYETVSSTYDRIDLGYYTDINYSSLKGSFSYNRFMPWKSILRSSNTLSVAYKNQILLCFKL